MKIMRITGIALIALGIIIVAVAALMNYMAEKKGTELVQAYLSYAEHITEIEYITEATTGENVQITKAAAEPVTIPQGVMGVIIMDKINLSAPLVEGTDNKSIRFALGHFEDTALPGETGNFAVAGHRSYTFGEYFNRLDEMTAGDTIKVMYGGNTYTYIVDESYVVEPEQTEVLAPTENAAITLITCTPKWTATHRLIVRGHLSEDNYG